MQEHQRLRSRDSASQYGLAFSRTERQIGVFEVLLARRRNHATCAHGHLDEEVAPEGCVLQLQPHELRAAEVLYRWQLPACTDGIPEDFNLQSISVSHDVLSKQP